MKQKWPKATGNQLIYSLLRNARQWPAKDAIREKEYGVWQTYTWRDYAEQVRRLGALGCRYLQLDDTSLA